MNKTKVMIIGEWQKWRVPGQEVDQRKLGERLWKQIVRHMD